MKTTSPLLIGSVLGLLLAAAWAPAGEVHWSYNWTPSTLVVAADAPGTGGISLTNEPANNASGESDIVATNLRTFSTALSSHPDHFTNAGYTLTLSLTDLNTKTSGTLQFSGLFSGVLSATYSHIKNVFTKPLTESLNLGGDLFAVTIGPYAPPGIPSSHNAGSIAAHVIITPKSGGGTGAPPPGGGHHHHGGGGGGHGHHHLAPEPSTLALSCLGLSYLGLASWRRRNRR